jgi:hypothetical protein
VQSFSEDLCAYLSMLKREQMVGAPNLNQRAP